MPDAWSPDDAPRRRRLPALLAGLGFLSTVALALAGAFGLFRSVAPPPAAPAPVEVATKPSPAPTPAVDVAPAPPPVPERFRAVTARLARNQTVAQALVKLDVQMTDVNGIIDALKGNLPFQRTRPGDQLRVERREGEAGVFRFSFREGPADEWIVERLPDGTFKGEKRAVAITKEIARVQVKIEGSLWASLERSGEDPELAVIASDALAWDVDFYQDVRPGDVLRVVVERVLVDGERLRYGDVIAAEYDGGTTGEKKIYRYTDPTGQTSYYDENGQSARRGFLKSPLRFAHVASGFGNRMHPILGYMRAHQGVDYSAPTGTPVWSVGDGRVEQAGWNGQCGKSVTIRHRNGYETVYCHLSQVNVSAGKQVSQKQVIGLVGATGLATGPHLHYAVKKAGTFVNPLHVNVPRDAPIPAQFLADFQEKIAPLRARLAGTDVVN
jgi:murein DD-endopeptidase MepM/ murein hydrolase activator NlpD